MKEFCCKFCHKLLLRYGRFSKQWFPEKGIIAKRSFDLAVMEIKCPKCKTINSMTEYEFIEA